MRQALLNGLCVWRRFAFASGADDVSRCSLFLRSPAAEPSRSCRSHTEARPSFRFPAASFAALRFPFHRAAVIYFVSHFRALNLNCYRLRDSSHSEISSLHRRPRVARLIYDLPVLRRLILALRHLRSFASQAVSSFHSPSITC